MKIMIYIICEKETILQKDIGHIIFFFDFNVALNQLRKKTFFERKKGEYGMDTVRK